MISPQGTAVPVIPAYTRTRHASLIYSAPAGAATYLLTVTSRCIVMGGAWSFATNGAHGLFAFRNSDGSFATVELSLHDGTYDSYLRAELLYNRGGNPFFSGRYDTGNVDGSVFLTAGWIYCPHGFRAGVQNTAGAAVTIDMVIDYLTA